MKYSYIPVYDFSISSSFLSSSKTLTYFFTEWPSEISIKNLLIIIILQLFTISCVSIQNREFPDEWGNLKNSTENNIFISGSFECFGESNEHYFRNVMVDSFLPHLLKTDVIMNGNCNSVIISQESYETLHIKVEFNGGVEFKTLSNTRDYVVKDGWYVFNKESTQPFQFGAIGSGKKVVSFSKNESGDLISRYNSSGLGFFFIPLLNIDTHWNIFKKLE